MKHPLLLPLMPLYAAGLAWKNRGFERHPERAETLTDPVVSVGSLSAGGAGKTPFVIALGEALRRAGIRFDVLSRGHGRQSNETLHVRPGGDATEFGDEPLLLARQLACPVYVARARADAGRMAEIDRRTRREDRAFALHLLDDGFQHRRLARAVDIVLLTAEDTADTLLPAGNLREPLRALHRADIIVLRSDEEALLRPVLARVFSEGHTPPVWIIQRRFFLVDKPAPRPLAFCGIARPESFRSALASAGVQPAALIALRDHQRYDEKLIARLVKRAAYAGADGIITTAKDNVKLNAAARARLAQVGPLAVGDIHVHLVEEQRCVQQALELVRNSWMRRAQAVGART